MTAHIGSAVASGVHTPAPTKPLASLVTLGKSPHFSVSSFSSESEVLNTTYLVGMKDGGAEGHNIICDVWEVPGTG